MFKPMGKTFRNYGKHGGDRRMNNISDSTPHRKPPARRSRRIHFFATARGPRHCRRRAIDSYAASANAGRKAGQRDRGN